MISSCHRSSGTCSKAGSQSRPQSPSGRLVPEQTPSSSGCTKTCTPSQKPEVLKLNVHQCRFPLVSLLCSESTRLRVNAGRRTEAGRVGSGPQCERRLVAKETGAGAKGRGAGGGGAEPGRLITE